jgi:hypothetical protein
MTRAERVEAVKQIIKGLAADSAVPLKDRAADLRDIKFFIDQLYVTGAVRSMASWRQGRSRRSNDT